MNFSSTDEYSNIVNSSSFKLLSDKRQNEILNNIKASELKARQEFKKDNPNSLLDKIKKSPELTGFAAGSILGVGSGIKIVKKAKNDLSKSFLNLFDAKKNKKYDYLDPTEIRFSQTTVSQVKKRINPITGEKIKYTFDDIVSSMKLKGWKGDPVNVVKMPDGSLTSMDNTRILTARQAGIKAKIIIHEYSSSIHTSFAKCYTTKGKEVPSTWGEAILNRIGSQNTKFYQDRIFYEKFYNGSIYDPKITKKGIK